MNAKRSPKLPGRPRLLLMLLSIHLAAIFGPVATADEGPPPINPEAIDAFVQAEMQVSHIPGAALAVVREDGIAYQKGFGVARPDGAKVTPQTSFILGSLSKSITAVGVMQLVEAGKIELDAPVERYLPWFRVADAQASGLITVRHLLNQTSGLPESVGVKGLDDGDTSDGALERHVRLLAMEELTQPPGRAMQYCNYNYTTLGLIIQTVSGTSYEDYVQRHIFTPLEMTHSFTSQAAAEKRGMATGYRLWFNVPVAAPDLPFVRGMAPGGYLISSTEDMSHYLMAHLNEGRHRDRSILSPAGMAELHRVSAARPLGFRDTKGYAGYAMGWFAGEMAGVPVLHHGGSTPNFASHMVIQPEERQGFVVLTNVFASNRLAEGTLSILSGRPAPRTESRPPLGADWLPLPLVQIAAFAISLLVLLRWRRNADKGQQPGPWGKAWRIGLPLLFDVGIIAWVIWQSAEINMPFRVTLLFFPALVVLPLTCAAFALVWGFIRTTASVKLLRRAG